MHTTIGREVDRIVYEEEVLPWLPPKILDCHTHVGLPEHCRSVSAHRKNQSWAMEVGVHDSWDRLRSNYRVLFPKQEVAALAFAGTWREVDTEAANEYVLAGASDPLNDASALYVTRPESSVSAIQKAFLRGFLGIKPYPDFSPQGGHEVSIYDFVPRSHLAAVNEFAGVLMLHLPRAGRLCDPDNVREVLEISDEFPDIRLILAHIGRAFCLPTAERGLPHFADRERVYFDTAANLNADVFECALSIIGPDRLLFGSDLPVTMMRGAREHLGETYVNYTDGPYLWNTDRKTPEEEANYTYYIYEELRALIRAVSRSRLGKDTLEGILYTNGAELLGIPLDRHSAESRSNGEVVLG